MEIFIYTPNFLGVKPLIEFIEYTFKYGARETKKPPIVVGTPSYDFFEAPPRDSRFIFIFYGIPLDKVQEGIGHLSGLYAKNQGKDIFVITKKVDGEVLGDPVLEFPYEYFELTKDINNPHMYSFLFSDEQEFENFFLSHLFNVIRKYDL